jgi:hypothetical protein
MPYSNKPSHQDQLESDVDLNKVASYYTQIKGCYYSISFKFSFSFLILINIIIHLLLYYDTMIGIPQGSVLSPLLCNLYYGNAERLIFGNKKELNYLKLNDKSLIIRLADDYIMISTDSDAVKHFLQRVRNNLYLYILKILLLSLLLLLYYFIFSLN